MSHLCPVCGYPNLYEPAYDGPVGSYEICPSCGFQFGVSDHDRHITFDQWRHQWIAKGMKWNGIGIKQPADWNPMQQLRNIISIN